MGAGRGSAYPASHNLVASLISNSLGWASFPYSLEKNSHPSDGIKPSRKHEEESIHLRCNGWSGWPEKKLLFYMRVLYWTFYHLIICRIDSNLYFCEKIT